MRRSGLFRCFSLYAGLLVCWLSTLTLSASSGSGASVPPEASLLRISVMDVGQGDGILIQAPNGKTAIIDGGPGANQGLLLNQLERLGVQQIDLMIETHPHEDHIGGFLAVLDRYPVRVFTDAGTVHTTQVYQNLLQKLKEKNVPTRVARKGQRYKLDSTVFVDVLAPRDPLISGTKADLNNNSVVVRLTYDGFSMIFTGDAELEGEVRLVEDGIPASNAIKVGHHGSRTSSSAPYLDMVKPQIAILSCEVGNDYGHPNAKTLTSLEGRAVKLFRTDQDGQVRLLTNGKEAWVKTFSRPSLTSQPPGGDLPPTRTEGPFKLRGVALEPVVQTPAPGPERPVAGTPESSSAPVTGGAFTASKNSKVFHKAACGTAKRISDANRTGYRTRDEAIAAGKEPSKDCNP